MARNRNRKPAGAPPSANSASSANKSPSSTIAAGVSSGRTVGQVSNSPGRQQLENGGMGYIARRGVPYQTAKLLQQIGGVERLAEFQPLELLMLCADLVPEASQAVWNFLLLGCAPGAVRLKAMTVQKEPAPPPSQAAQDDSDALPVDGDAELGGSEEAPDGTASIKALFDSQPQEAGGFESQLAQNVLMTLFSGMATVEAVPGPEMMGVNEVWPLDTLTLMFRRDADTQKLVLDQRQNSAGGTTLGTYVGIGSEMVPLPMERTFWNSMHRFPGDPYGRAPFAAALQPILDYLGFIRDLSIAFHRVGLPRYDVEFDFAGAIDEVTKLNPNLRDPVKIADAVKEKFDKFVRDFGSLQIDDAFFHPKGTLVNVTGSGKEMPDVESIFDIYRYRVVLGLKQNPVLMSFVEGSTETWSEIQWEVFANSLRAVVGVGLGPLKDASQLHVRLLGLPYKVEAEYAPVRTIARLQNAQAEAVELENESYKRDQGWQTQKTASQNATGSAPVAEAPAASPPPVSPDASPVPGSPQPAPPSRPRTPGGVPPGPAPVPTRPAPNKKDTKR